MSELRPRLFEPGRYASLPHTIMCRPELSASAKLVWMALAGHLGADGSSVWPSVPRLGMLTGLSRATVLRAIADLTEAGLICVDRFEGQRNRYRMLQPEAGLFDGAADSGQATTDIPSNPSQDATGIKMQPVSSCDDTRLNLIHGSTVRSKTEETPTPQPPAKAGGGVGRSNRREPNPPAAGASVDEAAVLSGVDAAHRAVLGVGMPAGWRRRVRRECRQGDPAAVAGIDAEAVRAGRELARKVNRTFGFGWVLKAATDRVATRRSQQEAREIVHAGEAGRRQAETAQVELRQRQRAHFAALPPQRRAEALARAAENRHCRNAANAEALAVLLAWRDREAGG